MSKTTKSDTQLDPTIKEQVENAVNATRDVVVVKIANLLQEELLSKNVLSSSKNPPKKITDIANTDFAKFIRNNITEAKKKELHQLMKDPLSEKIINRIASRVGVHYTKTISPALVALLANSTSPNDVITFFQIQSIDESQKLIEQLNANFTEQTLHKLFG